MKILSRLSASILTLLAASTAFAAETDSVKPTKQVSYIPQIHGTLRPRAEYSTDDNSYRFQLRNARLSLGGFAGTEVVEYYAQVDICDRGVMKFLDGWIRLHASDRLQFQAGQFRMPFGQDMFRAPHTYIFANRSFMGKTMFNRRAVGAMVNYTVPRTKLKLQAGIFNPGTIGNHAVWNKTIAFASKATLPIGNVTAVAGFSSVSPDSTRINAADAALTYKIGGWTFEGEYLYMHYANRSIHNSHGYNFWTDYRMPVKAGIFNRLSFQGRFDGMTNFSDGYFNNDPQLSVTAPRRNRLTVGCTLSYIRSANLFLDIRADYEKYFYSKGYTPTPENSDKIVLEMVLRF